MDALHARYVDQLKPYIKDLEITQKSEEIFVLASTLDSKIIPSLPELAKMLNIEGQVQIPMEDMTRLVSLMNLYASIVCQIDKTTSISNHADPNQHICKIAKENLGSDDEASFNSVEKMTKLIIYILNTLLKQ